MDQHQREGSSSIPDVLGEANEINEGEVTRSDIL